MVLELPVARIPSRALSFALDTAVVAVALTVVLAGVAVLAPVLSDSAVAAVGLSAAVLVGLGYPVAMETLNRGRTLGRLAVGLRVVRDDGGAVTFGQALVRGVAGLVDFVVTTGAGALLSALFSDRDKRIGDRLAGTFVVRERAPRRPRAAAVVATTPAVAGWSARADVVGLDDVLAGRVRAYLDRRPTLTAEADARIGAQLADLVARRVTPPPPGTPPADYLAAVLAGRAAREQRFRT